MIAVDVMPDAGAPQVGITLDGLSSPATVRVDVSWDGGVTWVSVRGASPVTASGSTFVRDFVPPLNVEARYRATVLAGTMSGATQATITVGSDLVWMQDPIAPHAQVGVELATETTFAALGVSSLTAFTRAQNADVVVVQGARLPVASVSTRMAPSRIPFAVQAWAAQGALRRQIRELVDQAGVLVLRGLPDEFGIDPVAHVAVGDVSDRTVALGHVRPGDLQFTEVSMSVQQVRPTSLRIVVPWFTYDDVTALVQAALGPGATYDDVLAAMPVGTTYLDAQKNPNVLTGGV